MSNLELENESIFNETFYVSYKGFYDETFLTQISQEKYEQSTREQIQRAKIIATLDSDNNFPMVAFNLTEIGPKEVYRDFDALPNKTLNERALKSYLYNYGINIMVGLAQGHGYYEGIFEMPSPELPDYRSMVICIKIENNKSIDTRLKNGYFQLNIFLPKKVTEFLPSFSSLERRILPIIKLNITNSSEITSALPYVKSQIMNILTEIVLFYIKWTPKLPI